jgi:hypothetical protein
MAKIRIPIEKAQVGDVIDGKPVVDVLHRNHASYVRLTLEGGWPIADGRFGDTIVVERRGGNA